jgi:type IV pilus assembly protein PilM
MPRAVGLDVGRRLLKLAVLGGKAKSFKVHKVVVEPMPEGTGEEAEAARVETIRRLFAEHRLGKDDVCVSFDAGTAVFRDVTVPFRQDDQIAKVVRFEAENHLHGRAIEDVIVNWVKTGETKDGSQVLVMAAPKAELAQRLALLRRAGIEPASVDLDATALYTACHASGVFEESPNVVVLEIGARTTNLLLIDGGVLRAVRSFLVGTDFVTSAIQQDLSLPAGEASSKALAGGTDADALLVPAAGRLGAAGAASETSKSVAELEQDVTAQRREELVRKLQREVMRSVASARAVNEPEKVLVAGGGSLLPEVPQALGERLGLPVEPLSLLTRLGHVPDVAEPALADAVSPVALGCALRLLGADPLGVELRREEFAPTNTFEVVRGVLATAVTLLVLLFAGLAYAAKERRDNEQHLFLGRHPNAVADKAATILQTVEKRYQSDVKGKDDKAAGDEARRIRSAIKPDAGYLNAVKKHLERRYRELEENLGLSKDIPPIESALDAWVEINKTLETIPREGLGWFRINKMAISQTSATFTIEFQDAAVQDKVVRAFNQSPYFKRRAKDSMRPALAGALSVNPATQRSTVSIELPFEESVR